MYEKYETKNFIVFADRKTGIWELHEKDTGDNVPIATCKYQVPLIVAANKLQATKKPPK